MAPHDQFVQGCERQCLRLGGRLPGRRLCAKILLDRRNLRLDPAQRHRLRLALASLLLGVLRLGLGLGVVLAAHATAAARAASGSTTGSLVATATALARLLCLLALRFLALALGFLLALQVVVPGATEFRQVRAQRLGAPLAILQLRLQLQTSSCCAGVAGGWRIVRSLRCEQRRRHELLVHRVVEGRLQDLELVVVGSEQSKHVFTQHGARAVDPGAEVQFLRTGCKHRDDHRGTPGVTRTAFTALEDDVHDKRLVLVPDARNGIQRRGCVLSGTSELRSQSLEVDASVRSGPDHVLRTVDRLEVGARSDDLGGLGRLLRRIGRECVRGLLNALHAQHGDRRHVVPDVDRRGPGLHQLPVEVGRGDRQALHRRDRCHELLGEPGRRQRHRVRRNLDAHCTVTEPPLELPRLPLENPVDLAVIGRLRADLDGRGAEVLPSGDACDGKHGNAQNDLLEVLLERVDSL